MARKGGGSSSYSKTDSPEVRRLDERGSEWQSPHLKAEQSLDGSSSKNNTRGERKEGGPAAPDSTEGGMSKVSNTC